MTKWETRGVYSTDYLFVRAYLLLGGVLHLADGLVQLLLELVLLLLQPEQKHEDIEPGQDKQTLALDYICRLAVSIFCSNCYPNRFPYSPPKYSKFNLSLLRRVCISTSLR